jgi:hypothetical protein
MNPDELRAVFLRLLTEDGPSSDRRRKDFNQAIFDADEGWAVWERTTLDMVMEKFDKAVKETGA